MCKISTSCNLKHSSVNKKKTKKHEMSLSDKKGNSEIILESHLTFATNTAKIQNNLYTEAKLITETSGLMF